jgi:hypothetical protein
MSASKTHRNRGLKCVVVMSFLSTALACHPGGDDSGDPAGYVGTWTYNDAVTNSTCPATDVITGLAFPGGALVITESGGGLNAVDRDGSSAMFTIDGSTATAQSGQTCQTSNGEIFNIVSWTIFVYDAQILWNERTISRTSSAGSSCSVSVTATVDR